MGNVSIETLSKNYLSSKSPFEILFICLLFNFASWIKQLNVFHTNISMSVRDTFICAIHTEHPSKVTRVLYALPIFMHL